MERSHQPSHSTSRTIIGSHWEVFASMFREGLQPNFLNSTPLEGPTIGPRLLEGPTLMPEPGDCGLRIHCPAPLPLLLCLYQEAFFPQWI
ncbi:hypothetical protein XELAEV_18005031mg [Xenopus laevis]|uniref:Uncharacterized protein n=1 Tax=Xenopus laevis TaxID=8355 RepID=A0A974I2I6_XENLA|nr:hypothetical protein XELAEV_18005031mg [Xenopus laevis]